MSITVCVPDMHVYNDSKIELIGDMIKQIEIIEPDMLLYMGDKGDPWEDSWESVLFTKSWNMLLKLEKDRYDKGLRNVWINYNHDASAKQGYGRHCELVSSFEQDGFVFMHGYEFDICFDDKTEVLTKKGWKLFKDLDVNDLVFTLDVKSRKAEYQLPSRRMEILYKGKMYKIRSTRVDLVVSPDHDLLVKKRGWLEYSKSKYVFVKPAEIFGKRYKILQGGIKWEGNSREYFVLPSHTYYNHSTKRHRAKVRIPIDMWLKFLGYFLSEGSCTCRRNKGCEVIISQTAGSKQYEEIRGFLMEGFPFVFHKRGDHAFGCSSIQLGNYLSRFGKSLDKFIPEEIKDLPSGNLKVLLDALLAGDGHKWGVGWHYYSVSKRLVDDVQEIAIKCGFTAKCGCWIRDKEKPLLINPNSRSNYDMQYVSILTSTEHTFSSKKTRADNTIEEWIDYSGYIYDVTVPNHTLLVRRNGKIAWSGNCWGGWGFVPGVHKAAFWLSRRFPNFSVKLWKWMRWNKGTAPSQMVDDVSTQDMIHYHVGMIHARELSYATENGVRLVVGHTHCPATYAPHLYDVGCIEDRKLLVIRDDKVASLDF